MGIKQHLASALIGAAYLAFAGPAAAQQFVLPTPENNPNASYGQFLDAQGNLRDAILMDGIPIAFKYDDFWSYSAKILESIQTNNAALIPIATFGQYDFTTGTGTIDINVSSVAGGATNIVDINGQTVTFQDPVDLFSNQQVDGWQCEWGNDPQYCDFEPPDQADYSAPAGDVNGVTTVGNLLLYLQSLDPTFSIPLIYADYNQTGAGDSLWLSAQVRIIDPNDPNNPVASWQLDSLTNNTWDQNNPTYNFGDILFGDAATCAAEGAWDPTTGVGCAGVTTSGEEYEGSHNLGSGHADFMAFAPDMDLRLYDPSFYFVVTLTVGCLPETLPGTAPFPGTTDQGCNTNGGEEFGFIGGVAPLLVPEPGSLALFGLGLLAAGVARRRR